MLEHSRIIVLIGILSWVGITLLLSELRWFNRTSLTNRLAPYAHGRLRRERQPIVIGFREALGPLASVIGERIARVVGVHDDLATRLERAQLPIDPGAFRLRQLGWAMASTCIALLVALMLQLPTILTLGFIVGAPLLAFLVLEQQLATAIQQRQSRGFAELPVVAEQLATLLGAGYSLGAALNRIGERNKGTTGVDLRKVCDRIRQGLSTRDALHEWAERSGMPEVQRLVAVLAFNSETSDLGRLVSAEAQAMRQESQRRLAQLIDKRAQQVWIPVTVATLVPGVIFLSIPFLEALRQFSAN